MLEEGIIPAVLADKGEGGRQASEDHPLLMIPQMPESMKWRKCPVETQSTALGGVAKEEVSPF
jgi:hypothetical protein